MRYGVKQFSPGITHHVRLVVFNNDERRARRLAQGFMDGNDNPSQYSWRRTTLETTAWCIYEIPEPEVNEWGEVSL